MASSASRALANLSSRLKPIASKLNNQRSSSMAAHSLESLSAKSAFESSSVRRFSVISRLPVELSCVGSMLPLHSAIASARLTSSLPMDPQAWGLVPQGISLPL